MHGLIVRQTAPISNADRGLAEPRKTSTPAQQPRTPLGHLGKLPVEIRLMIYRHVFQGSKVTFFTFSKEGLASYPHDSVRSGFRRLRKTPRARRTNHHKLLKVSSAFYKEAVCQYWHETVVTGRAFNQWRECCSLDMLARGLSQLVKNNIRHLRRIYINPIQLRSKDILAERNTALLADFKKLETLEFSSWELAATQQSLSPVAEGPAASVASEKVFMFKVGRGCDPRVALVNCYGLDVHEPALGRIHFLTKQLCPYYQFPLASRQGHCPRRSAVCDNRNSPLDNCYVYWGGPY